jgi:branched-chain amino acid transport system permease protein
MLVYVYEQIIIGALLLGAIYVLVSVGLNLIFGVMRLVNFAHGDFVMLGAYGTYWLFMLYSLNPFVSILVLFPFLFALSFLIYLVILEPLIESKDFMMVSLITTFGLSTALENIARYLWKSDVRAVYYWLPTINFAGLSIPSVRLVAAAIALMLTFLLHTFLTRTYLGKAIRAVSQNREASVTVGIDTRVVLALTFAVGSALAGAGGVLLSPIYPISPEMGFTYTITSFFVVVLGGLGSVSGALVGGLALGLLESWGAQFLGSSYSPLVGFLAIIVVLLVRPAGITGKIVR